MTSAAPCDLSGKANSASPLALGPVQTQGCGLLLCLGGNINQSVIRVSAHGGASPESSRAATP